MSVKSFTLLLCCVGYLSTRTDAFSFLPDQLSHEKYDEDAYEKMFPDDEILVSRRRMDPETDEEFWKKEDSDENEAKDVGDSYSFVSNLDGDANMVVNGINIGKLPANYHKTQKITKKIGGKNVTMTIIIDKKTNPKTGATSVSVIQSSNYGGIGSKQCTSATKCGKDNFCRKLLYGNFCSKCSNISDYCSSNEQCCGTGSPNALCVKGTCQTGYKKGEAGTICQHKSECNTKLCCSRTFMKHNGECKPLAKKGEKCAIDHSEINTILHGGRCPCAGNLVCSSGSFTESFFGGSMNGLLGGNTCRVEATTSHKGWMSGFWDQDVTDDDEDLEADDFLN